MPQDPMAEASHRWLGALDFSEELAVREKDHQERLSGFFQDLFEVADGFDRLLGAVGPPGRLPESVSVENVRTLARLLTGCLERQGVVPVSCLGETVDPETHEVEAVRESPGAESDVVVEVARRGYRWDGHLLRRPRVVVAAHLKEEQP